MPIMPDARSAEQLNAQLRERYGSSFSRWPAVANLGRELSQPQLMRIPQDYLNSQIRLMIVGQESDGWGEAGWDPMNATDREKLLNDYESFNLAIPTKWRGTPFWQAAYHFRDLINPGGPTGGFLWSNLSPVSERLPNGKYGPPSPEVVGAIASLGLLVTEVEVARPEVVIFFSGKNRDSLLTNLFKDAVLTDCGDGVAMVAGLPGEPIAYRTEHPRRLRGTNQWSVLDRVATLVKTALLPKTETL